jgi:hypothetical protein
MESIRYISFHIGKQRQVIMENNNNQISTEEALASLGSIKNTKRKSVQAFRAPLWLNSIISLSTGGVCFAAPLSSGNGQWSFILLVAVAVMFIGLGSYVILLRLRGVKQYVVPVNFKGRIFTIIQIALSMAVIIGSIELYKAGYLWTPYVSALLHTILTSYILYNFPTGEWQ